MIIIFSNIIDGVVAFRKLLLFCLAGFVVTMIFPKGGFSQDTSGLVKTDSITYVLYEKQQWDELIKVGEAAIKNGTDFYYLRMRLGIARYVQHNYRHAIPHFEKAIVFVPGDQIAYEYLYYSYLFAGRGSDSKRIRPHLNETTKAKMGLAKSSFIDEIYFEGGPGISDFEELKKNWSHSAKTDTIYSSTTYFKGYEYFHGGIRLNIFPKLGIYQGYGLLDAPAQQNIRYNKTERQQFERTAVQNEYYGNVELQLPNGFKITGASHFLWINYESRMAYYDPEINDIAFDTLANNIDDYVVSLSVKKDFSFGTININGTYGELDKDEVEQLGLSFIYYPYGNLNFYGITGIGNKWDREGSRQIFTQEIGIKLFNNVWVEGNATIGSLMNYSENNAFVVYNAPEDIDNKYEAVLIFAATRHFEFSVRYRYMQRESGYLDYKDFEKPEIIKTKYPYHSIIGGIKWKF